MTFSLLYAADFADRLEHQIIPALRAGFIVIADRYMYTAFARNMVMGADPAWTRELSLLALPDLVLYLESTSNPCPAPRGQGMDYWESGMHLALGNDISIRSSVIAAAARGVNSLAHEFGCFSGHARRRSSHPGDLREHISPTLRPAAKAGSEAADPSPRAHADAGEMSLVAPSAPRRSRDEPVRLPAARLSALDLRVAPPLKTVCASAR